MIPSLFIKYTLSLDACLPVGKGEGRVRVRRFHFSLPFIPSRRGRG